MIKIFLTGDNHFGLRYDRFPDAQERLIESRYEALKNCIHSAEEENCEFFVVAGDLFEKTTVAQGIIKRVVEILESFSGRVLVLPGNHDYYTEETKLWKHFCKACTKGNVLVLNEYKPKEFDCDSDEKLIVYPAFCDSKHSKANKLQWIKDANISEDSDYRIGIAHGAIRGVTPDMKYEYFLMEVDELNNIPVDAWLIGHTHIPYPDLGVEDKDAKDTEHIYNAGTHQQTHLSNNSAGYGFVITLEREGSDRKVKAHAVQTGVMRFADIDIKLDSQNYNLKDLIKDKLADYDLSKTVVRANLKGTMPREAYETWRKDFGEAVSGCLASEADDTELSEELTMEFIREEFPEMGAPYKLLEQLMENSKDPKEVQMTYELLKECSDKGARG